MVREFIHPEDRAKVDAAFLASLGGRKPFTIDYRIVMPDGRIKILEERWQAFHNEEGKPARLAGTCRDITERVRAEEELRRLSGQLLRLQDEERRKIARDLHDSTGQDLVALATTLGQLHQSVPSSARQARKLLSVCRALAESSIREIRTLSYLLHPPMLDEAGLVEAVRHFVAGFAERTGIEVDLDVAPQFGRLRPDRELALFRMIQESLVNIQRHSGSFTARIRMDRDAEEITLEVSDAGRGISGGQRMQNKSIPPKTGVGIPSMQERVTQIGGRFEIDSGSHGTTVRITIPGEGK
jgi:signal transduction histidine kinase